MTELRVFTNIGSLLALVLLVGGWLGHPTLLAMAAMCWLVSLLGGCLVAARLYLAGRLSMERGAITLVGYMIMLAAAVWFVLDTLDRL